MPIYDNYKILFYLSKSVIVQNEPFNFQSTREINVLKANNLRNM